MNLEDSVRASLALLFLLLCLHEAGRCNAIVNDSNKFQDPTAHSIRKRSSSDSPTADPLKGRKVVCLFNNLNFYKNGFTPLMIEADNCTHINYEFAILDPTTYELTPGAKELDFDKNFFADIISLKFLNPSLKVLISIGGWHDSTKKYSELVESPERVDNFIDKVIPFLKEHQFDGLNVAWEYPNCWQGALGISPKDKKNFAEFLKKIREKFDPEDLILSISAGAIKREIIAGYDGPAVSSAVHHINVMTYDMHGPWDRKTGHHAQFDKKPDDEDEFLNMKSALEVWAGLGVEKMKLIAGIPLYGKTFTLSDPNNHGIGAPVKGPGRSKDGSKANEYMCFNEICKLVNAGNWTEEEDKKHGYYAYSGDQWICYDPPMMVVRKVKWVVDNGYGGVVMKDLSCDDYFGDCLSMENPLLRMGKMEMIHRIKKLH